MTEAPYVIGVDGGTESLRAAVFDRNGAPLASVATPYPTRFPAPGRAEQNPQDWWAALVASVRGAVGQAGIATDAISGLCLDTTCCSVVALDASGEPLRPSLIWMDVRAHAEADRLGATGDPALAVNGGGAGPVSAEWMLPKALWLKTHEPETYTAAATICEYQDYLNLRLTGRRVTSINNVAVRWHRGGPDNAVPESLMAAAGLDDLADKWPAETAGLGEPIGGLTPAAAAAMGLPAGLPVAQGGADAFIGMIGVGAVRPGRMAFVTGSSHLHLGLSETAFHGAGIWGTYANALLPGLHVVEGGQTSTGSVVAWLKRLVAPDVDYVTLTAEAAALPPGADGLLVQEHFQGNRTPHTDPLSRGAFVGLTLAHERGHLFRAVLESIAFGTELILEGFRNHGFEPDEVVVCGGATRSDLWLQIHADVSGVPLIVTRVPDAPLLGSAVLASVGAGLDQDIPSAADRMVRVDRRIEPDRDRHEAYRAIYGRYKALYPALGSALRG